MKLITTSWDDGHELDFRIAELLEKYQLKGTFYIPASNEEHAVMNEQQVVELSKRFEIGGHTMGHTRIYSNSEKVFREEIKGCYDWLSSLLGKSPDSFCFPGGIYNSAAVAYAQKAGFKIIRTTELLNPSINSAAPLTPTTLQVYPHSTFTFYKHLLKRGKITSLLRYMKSGQSNQIETNLEYYLDYIQHNGGCFHLWGHSWEIEENNLWTTLEELFKRLCNRNEFSYVSNGELSTYKHQTNN